MLLPADELAHLTLSYASYFHLFIIFLPLLILHHAPCQHDLLCNSHKPL